MAKKKSNNTLLIILIVIAVILVIALILYFFLIKENYKNKKGKKKGKKKDKENTTSSIPTTGPTTYIETDDVFLDYRSIKNLKNLSASDIKKIEPLEPRKAIEKVYHISPNGQYLYAAVTPKKTLMEYIMRNWARVKYTPSGSNAFPNWQKTEGSKFYNADGSMKIKLFDEEKEAYLKYIKKVVNKECGQIFKDKKRCNGSNYCKFDETTQKCIRSDGYYDDSLSNYYILYIYDIKERKIIDTIQDIGYCRGITSNGDGSIISFSSEKNYDHKNDKSLDQGPEKEKGKQEFVFTYKLNANTSKFEQFIDPIIEEQNTDYWKTPWNLFMSSDGQKLIVNYDLAVGEGTIHIYDLIGSKWQLKQLITKDDEFKQAIYDGHNATLTLKLCGISDDFNTFLVTAEQSDIAMVYRFNKTNDKYQKIGQHFTWDVNLINGKDYNRFYFRHGAIDQTGNRIALSVHGKDLVVIYEYKQQQNKWIETQRISRPTDIILLPGKVHENIDFGRSIAFTDQGKQLLIGSNVVKRPFVNIYNLDLMDNQYKFFERLTATRDYIYFGSEIPKISKDGKTIVIGSRSVLKSEGGIQIFRIKEPGVVSNIKQLSKKERRKRKEERDFAQNMQKLF